jgi:hypothetical protein
MVRVTELLYEWKIVGVSARFILLASLLTSGDGSLFDHKIPIMGKLLQQCSVDDELRLHILIVQAQGAEQKGAFILTQSVL